MIIKAVHVKNFRCLLDATITCEPLTAIVGPNGSGKSSFLRALELFYAVNPRFSQEDFYNRDVQTDIEISVTFSELDPGAQKRFASYLEGGDLTVTRVLSLRDGRPSARSHGVHLQNPDFVPVRQAGPATAVRQQYDAVRQRAEYNDLPSVRSEVAARQAMQEWEERHHDRCTRLPDDGQFFGFTEVAQGYLGRFTRFIPIPAVREAAEDAVEGRGHVITEIVDLVVRATLANRQDLATLKSEAQLRYNQIMAPGTVSELDSLAERLTKTLKTYVPDASVKLEWLTEGGVEISLPKADPRLVEDQYATPVGNAGHGLQRAFILTMLQHLVAAQAEATAQAPQEGAEDVSAQPQSDSAPTSSIAMPSLVLGIEEPELYQHPNRQRHLADIFLQLASGAVPGVAPKTQVIYTTHSPLFVGLDRLDQVRVLRKHPNGNEMPKITTVVEVEGDAVAEALWEACGRVDASGKPVAKYTWETLRPRLQSIMTPWMAEGYFADVVVLVEGEEDRAAILGMALAKAQNLETLGISVLPCGGKTCLDRPYLVFQQFGILVYLVWDGDKNGGAKARENHILLRLAGAPVTDWPSGVTESYACFENRLEDTVRTEIGATVFDSLLSEVQSDLEYSDREDAVKNPYLFRELLRRAWERGSRSPTLESTVDAILQLKSHQGRERP